MNDRTIHRAVRADIPVIAALLADDFIGHAREGAPLTAYEAGFAAVEADHNPLLAVAESGGEVVGTMQISVIPACSAADAGAAMSRRCGWPAHGADRRSARR